MNVFDFFDIYSVDIQKRYESGYAKDINYIMITPKDDVTKLQSGVDELIQLHDANYCTTTASIIKYTNDVPYLHCTCVINKTGE